MFVNFLKNSWPILIGLVVLIALLENFLPFVSIWQDVVLFGAGLALVILGLLRLVLRHRYMDEVCDMCHNLTCHIRICLNRLTFAISRYNQSNEQEQEEGE